MKKTECGRRKSCAQRAFVPFLHSSLFILPLSLALALLAGCATGPLFNARTASAARLAALANFTTVTATNPATADLLEPPTGNYTLGPGDRLEIEISGDPTTRTITTVGPDGKIYFYLLPGVNVWGLTLDQARARIEQGLLNYEREKPEVNLTLLNAESQRVWLLGRLNQPGVYPLTGPTTLLAALAEAGGTTSPGMLASLGGGAVPPSLSQDVADLHHSFVMRDGRILPVNFYRLVKDGDMSQNIYLRPNDFIYVPSASEQEVYVLGAVNAPVAAPFQREMSLISAIAAAEGTAKYAYLSRVAIVRGSLTRPEIAIVNYHAVVEGKAANLLLEPGDIVYVPLSPYRTLEEYADLIVRTFADTVAINEGARAVSRNVVPVGVSIGGGATQP